MIATTHAAASGKMSPAGMPAMGMKKASEARKITEICFVDSLIDRQIKSVFRLRHN